MVSDAIKNNRSYYIKSLADDDEFSRLDAWYKVNFLIENNILDRDYVVNHKDLFLDLLTTDDEMVKVHAWVLARRFADAGYISKEDIEKRKDYLLPYIKAGDLTAWWNADDLINGKYLEPDYLRKYKDIFIEKLHDSDIGTLTDAWHMIPLMLRDNIINRDDYVKYKSHILSVLDQKNPYIRLNGWETIINLTEAGVLSREDVAPYKDKAGELLKGDDIIKLTSLFDTTVEKFKERLKNIGLI
ncbi:hypothetical protein [Picrophilus oshimae]|uniref:Uncharacterized protein n=1 Tax=Picrophilus torridus (strain ATCC 700027 / DSM 9790 / JCM 10055 / NBRC 100828 / KAW 2/3) TaxID=1122961 RepID=Q6L0S5_PICTO|nr:hypothetical protein [Picrophilus oshimae]AAT43427.1 hypothetical protein PTO0842 [Picrophilus oshimae DSM 9789]